MRSLLAIALALVPSVVFADVPLDDSAFEVSGGTRAELRTEFGSRTRFGGYLGYRFSTTGFAAGATTAWILRRHRGTTVRLHGRLGGSYYSGQPRGGSVDGRAGVRTLVLGRHLGFWLGPQVDAVVGFERAQQRVTPRLAAGFGGGPKNWPWLWASGDVGYSFGGAGAGAVRATWLVSITHRW